VHNAHRTQITTTTTTNAAITTTTATTLTPTNLPHTTVTITTTTIIIIVNGGAQQNTVADLNDPSNEGHGSIDWWVVEGNVGWSNKFTVVGGANVAVAQLGGKARRV